MVKKIFIFMFLVFNLLFISCTIESENFDKFFENSENYLDKNLNIKGKISFFEDGYYYLVDSNNRKLKLKKCEKNYNLELGKNYILRGYFSKNNNELIFNCGDFETDLKNVDSKITNYYNNLKFLNESILIQRKNLENIEKNFSKKINNKKIQLNNLNTQINNKKQELNKLTQTLAKEKEIALVKSEITDKLKSFPVPIKIEDFKKWVVLGMEPYKTDLVITDEYKYKWLSSGGFYNIDKYYKISKFNSNYSITINAYRTDDIYYYKYEIIIENNYDKYLCSKIDKK